MPMMIVNEEEWLRESGGNGSENHSDHDKNNGSTTDHETGAVIINMPQRGRKPNSTEVPTELRALAGITALEGSSNSEVAKAFGISESSVSAYKHGATSTSSYDRPNELLAPRIEKALEKIHNRARNRLNAALKSLTPAKIEAAKTREIASIAKDMASIIEKTSPKNPLIQNNNIVLYTPHQVKAENYEVIDAPVTSAITS